MKKSYMLLLSCMAIFLVSCTKKESSKDQVKPILNLSPESVELEYGQPFDLNSGIAAMDNVDGIITDKIEIDDAGFDPTKPGTYEIKYSVKDSSDNVTIKIRTIIVKALPSYSEGYSMKEIYYGTIEGEKQPPAEADVFNGDWSRKAESSKDLWLGMEAVVTLPYFKGDDDRFGEVPGGYNSYFDNPSIYFGTNAGREADVGFSYDIGVLPNGQLSREKFAYRPIWRYITTDWQNIWNNADDYNPYNFYFPGDKVRMSVFSPKPHYLQLKIEVIEPTKDPKYVELRKEYGIYYPHDFLSPEFPSTGHGVMLARFMRVNAIDQYYNEGQITNPTKARVENAIWHEVYLYRKIGREVYKVPFTEERYASNARPSEKGFVISYEGVDKSLGGEIVSILPENATDYDPFKED